MISAAEVAREIALIKAAADAGNVDIALEIAKRNPIILPQQSLPRVKVRCKWPLMIEKVFFPARLLDWQVSLPVMPFKLQ